MSLGEATAMGLALPLGEEKAMSGNILGAWRAGSYLGTSKGHAPLRSLSL